MEQEQEGVKAGYYVIAAACHRRLTLWLCSSCGCCAAAGMLQSLINDPVCVLAVSSTVNALPQNAAAGLK
jgi:hypothetical protein